jgi:hypothetical protein
MYLIRVSTAREDVVDTCKFQKEAETRRALHDSSHLVV